jgi:hypothetical protein
MFWINNNQAIRPSAIGSVEYKHNTKTIVFWHSGTFTTVPLREGFNTLPEGCPSMNSLPDEVIAKIGVAVLSVLVSDLCKSDDKLQTMEAVFYYTILGFLEEAGYIEVSDDEVTQ